MPGISAFRSRDDFEKIINSNDVVVVDFTATWCGPCHMMSPLFVQHSRDEAYSGIKFYTVDVDDQSDISIAVGIRAMPTFMLFHSGERVGELIGANPAKLKELIAQGVKRL